MKNKNIFSIIVPVYQNESNLEDTLQKLLGLKERLPNHDLEIIFVDDGSTDKSYVIMKKYYELYKESLVIVKLTRNFGQNAAIYAGLQLAHGDCAGIISADLQDPYELFIEMIKKWESGIKLVIAERLKREDNKIVSLCSRLYWKMVSRYAVKDFPEGGFDFCLIDKQVVSDLIKINEKNSHIFVLMFSLGYPYEIIFYARKKRTLGKSRWSLSKKINLFIDTFVAFSYLPIRAISFLGLLISLVSFGYAIAIIINRVIKGNVYPGWTTTVALISFLCGLILLTLGIIGEYLWRILEETRKRPHYIIDKILRRNSAEHDYLS